MTSSYITGQPRIQTYKYQGRVFSNELKPVSHPISTDYPTQRELDETKKIEAILKEYNYYPTEENKTLRETILKQLNDLFDQFIKDLYKSKSDTQVNIDLVRGKVLPFGSYALDAYHAGSDMDILCVAPKLIDKQMFFEIFSEYLLKNVNITNVKAITTAYTPIIKFKFYTIEIDLTFSAVDLDYIPDDFEITDEVVNNAVNPELARSLNGRRVCRLTLELVPNHANFRTALKFIKLFGSIRGLTSNIMGYFGGVAWSLSLARICQLYPYATASRLILEYFRIMYEWKWPHPMMLTEIVSDEAGYWLPSGWDPLNKHVDQHYRMPIITPSAPSMCCTHNVIRSTKHIITFELEKAHKLADAAMKNRSSWTDLLKEMPFFTKYSRYIRFSVFSFDENILKDQSGLLESKLRKFVDLIDVSPSISFAHPWPKPVSITYRCSKEHVAALREGKFDCLKGIHKIPLENRPFTVYSTNFYVGIRLSPNPIAINDEEIKSHEAIYNEDFQKNVENFKFINTEDANESFWFNITQASYKDLPYSVRPRKQKFTSVIVINTTTAITTNENGVTTSPTTSGEAQAVVTNDQNVIVPPTSLNVPIRPKRVLESEPSESEVQNIKKPNLKK